MTVAVESSLPSRMIRAAKLDESLYEEVEHDTNATTQAAIVVTIAAVASGIAAMIRADMSIVALIAGIVGGLIGWVLWAAITLFAGRTFFATDETSVDLGEMLRVLGFSSTPGILAFLGFIPILGPIVSFVIGIWQLIAGVIAVRQAMDFSTGRAIGTVIVGWIVQFILGIILALIIAPFMS